MELEPGDDTRELSREGQAGTVRPAKALLKGHSVCESSEVGKIMVCWETAFSLEYKICAAK